ncbi:geranylgeranylglyceryl/heptaprenylglyceryl phosphate synthase [Nonlabens sp. MB-3u-79]|jgi:phosphoglycerol geranylgeranyltransferase|uniref:geranylgeranylglyceryl/heptaprenylglyceryl phosphate synthase n=1 Tax=Nonlabens sp. MB-3u-79 TaxID=2058134 RepID=UPI000C30A43A|nr:geranylgeranylglyceryl/heptaprenylglyceryl phosphate synthase [Nonlabens sp. MB-3u-79]AUC78579.1 geranylgeranylglyceryl/heptaprenylglyceryl phosphate synthase [Nonlabens sp. MB-3u-79]|tara:strand:+ start:33842 stop:34573 length:732 start_codon:yes stop_codon:yes gene_type:complete
MPELLKSIQQANRSLAVLIDPEKMELDAIEAFAKAIPLTLSSLKKKLQIDQFFFFVGGSTMENTDINQWIKKLKEHTDTAVVLFPGSPEQLSENADGLLFLSLLSGRNPEFLIAHQVAAAMQLKKTHLEVIPTGYLLIDGGKETAVQRVSKTVPLSQNHIQNIVNHAYAAALMGNQLIYLEAGSGAVKSVAAEIVREVSAQINVPLIVGGGLRTIAQIEAVYNAGAKIVVVGTAIEENINWNG